MLRSLKRLINSARTDSLPHSSFEQRNLHNAVAVLLHEARRADYSEAKEESNMAERALVDLFGLDAKESAAVLEEGRHKAQQFNSFYAPLAVIKREFSMEQRVRLVEHLWRIAFADGQLNLYEDHYVRKIAHLLYVSNTDNMLARNRARP